MRERRRGLARTARSSSTSSSKTPPRSMSTASATARPPSSAAIMEHIEEAGIHSGDCACVIPPYSPAADDAGRDHARRRTSWPRRSTCSGLMNIQFAVEGRASSTSSKSTRAPAHRAVRLKAIGVPLAEARRQVMAGKTLDGTRLHRGDHPAALLREGSRLPVQPVPRRRHHPRPGDEDRTGEVMGIDADLGMAFAKSPDGRRQRRCRPRATSSSASPTATSRSPCRSPASYVDLGFTLYATSGTGDAPSQGRAIPVHTAPQAQRRPPPERPRHDEERRDRT